MADNSDSEDITFTVSQLDSILNHPEVAKMSPSEIEAALTGHEFLREILGMLKQDIELKRAALLQKNIEEKMKLEESKNLQQESKKLTDLGIGLHKQGQIIDQMRAEQRQIRRKLAQQSKAIDLPPQERNVRIQKLLRRRAELEEMMNRLIEAVIAEQKYNTIRQVLSTQERILNSGVAQSSLSIGSGEATRNVGTGSLQLPLNTNTPALA